MSWIHKLHDTYEACLGHEPDGAERLLPVSHAYQQAHVEITLTGDGKFESARVIGKEETVVPATEDSANRTANCAPHPLCDKIQYCAADYQKWGGKKKPFFNEYREQLADWCSSPYRHPKAVAIFAYLQHGTLTEDLIKEKILHIGVDGKLLIREKSIDKSLKKEKEQFEIFKSITAKEGVKDQGDAFIRWHVKSMHDPCTAVWEDKSLFESWINYDASTKNTVGFCIVTGESNVALGLKHPRRVRKSDDGAKLISSNDKSGFVFRGRFTDKTGVQACSIGYVVSQKAHNALRWLINRQSYRNGDQVIVSWATNGSAIPDPLLNSFDLWGEGTHADVVNITIVDHSAGQVYAQRLARALRGYRANLEDSDGIVVMGLDSATDGRISITYYRELTGSEFLARIEQWHTRFAWKQDFGKNRHGKHQRFVGAPSPEDIAEAAYTRYSNDKASLDETLKKVKKSTVARLVPCLIDGQRFPLDLLKLVVHRASQRVSLPHWAWEKTLGIACALHRGTFHQEEYAMALETERTTRDYLYGRLLALAEHIEKAALTGSEKNRDTSATKLMQRFAERPASTWLTIELALKPYKSRLRSSKGGLMHNLDSLHDQIVCAFQGNDFTDDSRLSGEFLLGYHCQREALKPPPKPAESGTDTTEPKPV